LKLAPLLAEYLYINKRLDLPGIGTFRLDPAVMIEEESNKHSKTGEMAGISFQNDPTIKETTELINFICTRTGKMKALAAADLDSHLELVQQFLNIGKPFLFEGIGSLVKIKSGQFEFTSGEVMSEKIKEYSIKEISATSSTEDSFTDYDNIFSPKKIKLRWRRPVLLLLLLAGVALAIWGGYKIYKSRAAKNNVAVAPEKKTETVPLPDSSQVIKKIDSLVPEKTITETGNYKFVVETADKERGLLRFSMLKGYGLAIQIETKDSVNFKLFFLLPAAPSDTTRMIDSLHLLYTPPWSKAFVEN
jgi:hypothetical protein